MIVNSATFFMALSIVGAAPRCEWRSVMGGTGEACTRPGPSVAREPFLQRSGREEPRRGGEKSSALGLRAAPATIGNPPCNRARGSHVDELMNRGLTTASVGSVPRPARSGHGLSAGTAD